MRMRAETTDGHKVNILDAEKLIHQRYWYIDCKNNYFFFALFIYAHCSVTLQVLPWRNEVYFPVS